MGNLIAFGYLIIALIATSMWVMFAESLRR
jgi:uncharacterized membrane protein (DUF485 family)